MRVFLSIFLALFATDCFACFVPPVALSGEHKLIFARDFGVGSVLFLVALILRYNSQKSRFWVPLSVGLSLGYIPSIMYILFMEGIAGPGGACGRPELLEMGNVILISFSILAVYEVLRWFRRRRKNGL
ncbi:hypothetical protein [Aliiglaciecola lipolytica]|uniref:Uncharacterized protein n=1 Tax=Aliiglaciecola lipolytica E3 TaxID=1127673 RepID=K6YZ01_9ALTE|nr:hypothetical protein [Aliiglaciecola lipolytica]GAC16435.1 hypothetical protein GLIP_3824 [Aliiglaciecola lipolytica E3]